MTGYVFFFIFFLILIIDMLLQSMSTFPVVLCLPTMFISFRALLVFSCILINCTVSSLKANKRSQNNEPNEKAHVRRTKRLTKDGGEESSKKGAKKKKRKANISDEMWSLKPAVS